MKDIAVIGELTADNARIVLIASGLDENILFAARRLGQITPKVKPTNPSGAVELVASWPAVVQLSHLYGSAWRPGPRLAAWTEDQVRRRMDRTDLPLTFGLPSGLTPYPWQVEGARVIAATGHALITDEPGTGKTMTTILGLLQRSADGHPVFPALVVAPSSVVDPWVEAWRTWAPMLSVVTYRGTPKKRMSMARCRPPAHVYVTSYDIARMDAPPNAKTHNAPLLELGARSVVIDECHLIKSPHAQRSLAVRRLAARASNAGGCVVALSGTPITHHPGNLWPALNALEPEAWPSRERFDRRYLDTVPGDYSPTVLGLNRAREPEFRLTLLGQHRRVAKADVLADLPPKVYSVRTVELPPTYRKAYQQMEDDMLAELPDGGELSVMTVLAQLTRLSQLASAAADVSTEYVVDEDEYGNAIEKQSVHVKLRAPSWKVDALLELLAERPGQPVVAFAPSRQLVMLAGQAAEKAGLTVGYIVGQQSPRERTENVDAFQAGKLDLICVTTQAGGVGLTLTAARTAVFLQRPWSLVDALQAEDRCHRIGSEIHDSIEIVDIVASNTIDSRVRSVLRGKAGQLADLVQDPRIVAELLGGESVTKIKKAS